MKFLKGFWTTPRISYNWDHALKDEKDSEEFNDSADAAREGVDANVRNVEKEMELVFLKRPFSFIK